MLKFNILYTRGTVKYLHFLAFSYSKWSDCSFRLVANGCSAKETALLQEYCSQHDWLESLVLPNRTTVTHGEALSYLQSLERSDYFCFTDSDVVTTGDIAQAIMPHLDSHAAYFSGSPLYCKEEDRILPAAFQKMYGRHTYTDQGVCLGSSFFAVYDNRILDEVIQSTGVDFQRRLWPAVPPRIQDQIAALCLKKLTYDTGKLVNLLLVARGATVLAKETPGLQHLGGLSLVVGRSAKRRLAKVRALARRLPGRASRCLLRWLGPPNWTGGDSNLSQAEIMDAQAWQRKKRTCSRYSASLLRALFADQPLPSAPNLGDTEIDTRVDEATKSIISLYQAFRA